MVKIRFLYALLIPFLSSCSLIEDCRKCHNCECDCSNNKIKQVIFLNLDNYSYFIKKDVELNIIDEQKNFSLSFSGLADKAKYIVSLKYEIIDSLNCINKEETILLDNCGYGKTPAYIFDYSGLIEDFTGINVIGVLGTISY